MTDTTEEAPRKGLTDAQRRRFIQSYNPDVTRTPDGKKLGRARAAAHALAWFADVAPYEWVKWSELLKMIEGYKHWPRDTNKEVERLKSLRSQIHAALLKYHDKARHSNTDLGTRASVDQWDMIEDPVAKQHGRNDSAVAGMKKLTDIIGPSSGLKPKDERERRLKQAYKNKTEAMVTMLYEGGFVNQLPPREKNRKAPRDKGKKGRPKK